MLDVLEAVGPERLGADAGEHLLLDQPPPERVGGPLDRERLRPPERLLLLLLDDAGRGLVGLLPVLARGLAARDEHGEGEG